MPTKNPRLNVVLEERVYKVLSVLARKKGVSLSLLARDLLNKALEFDEDAYWYSVALKRDKTFSSDKALSHEEAWK